MSSESRTKTLIDLKTGEFTPVAHTAFRTIFLRFASEQTVAPRSSTERVNFLLGTRADSGPNCSIRLHLTESAALYDRNVLSLITELLDTEWAMTCDDMSRYILACGAGQASCQPARLLEIFSTYGRPRIARAKPAFSTGASKYSAAAAISNSSNSAAAATPTADAAAAPASSVATATAAAAAAAAAAVKVGRTVRRKPKNSNPGGDSTTRPPRHKKTSASGNAKGARSHWECLSCSSLNRFGTTLCSLCAQPQPDTSRGPIVELASEDAAIAADRKKYGTGGEPPTGFDNDSEDEKDAAVMTAAAPAVTGATDSKAAAAVAASTNSTAPAAAAAVTPNPPTTSGDAKAAATAAPTPQSGDAKAAAPAAVPARAPWNCGRCTYQNLATAHECELCQGPSPRVVTMTGSLLDADRRNREVAAINSNPDTVTKLRALVMPYAGFARFYLAALEDRPDAVFHDMSTHGFEENGEPTTPEIEAARGERVRKRILEAQALERERGAGRAGIIPASITPEMLTAHATEIAAFKVALDSMGIAWELAPVAGPAPTAGGGAAPTDAAAAAAAAAAVAARRAEQTNTRLFRVLSTAGFDVDAAVLAMMGVAD